MKTKQRSRRRYDKRILICMAERDRRRLDELAQAREASLSATIRSLIKKAHQEEVINAG